MVTQQTHKGLTEPLHWVSNYRDFDSISPKTPFYISAKDDFSKFTSQTWPTTYLP
jgi:hypothetical protein